MSNGEAVVNTQPYLVILDNNLIKEPLAPGLPYWTFLTPELPTAETAAAFVEDVLFQSELWANDGDELEWKTLRLLDCVAMCARCGHVIVRVRGDDSPPFHVVWYIVGERCAEGVGAEALLRSGAWYEGYLAHRCGERYFAPAVPGL